MLTRNPYFESQYYFYAEVKNNCKMFAKTNQKTRQPENKQNESFSKFVNTKQDFAKGINKNL